MPFQDLNSALYNAVAEKLKLQTVSFALFQPANPALDTDDLWNHYFNLIPARSLMSNLSLTGGAQFFDNYCALNSALQSTRFDLPKEVRQGFQTVLRAKQAPLSPSQYPAIFRDWASHRLPILVSTAGAAALAATLKDPVADGQLRLMPYLGDPGANPPIPAKQPDWTGTFEQLQKQLAAGPPLAFNYRHSNVSKDVSKTWAGGRSNLSFGLTTAGNIASSESLKFAGSDFTVDASFAHVSMFTAAPGPWFSPVTMALAFRNKGKAPWVSGSPVTWDTTFNQDTGNLARYFSSLLVVDTMNIHITSSAKFTKEEQTNIGQNAKQGFWPFYVKPDARQLSRTLHTFQPTGQMDLITTSQPGIPMVLGGVVASADSESAFEKLLHN